MPAAGLGRYVPICKYGEDMLDTQNTYMRAGWGGNPPCPTTPSQVISGEEGGRRVGGTWGDYGEGALMIFRMAPYGTIRHHMAP